LIKFSKKKKSPISIDLIISNNPKAKGLKLGKINKIKRKVYNFKKKYKIENQILSDLKERKVKIICLAGFMKVLSRNFINKFKGKILNIHPSLLPKYKGLNTHQRALNNNEKYSGCTVHLVNSKLDAGRIVLQKRVKISKNETMNSLAKKVLVQEHKLYPKAILKVFNL
ncbi:MAG: phosphoribosylglycinamide formyltransferase, partial [Pseudomonadota bacterium]|nr:phosphoribosylglycinamide formyltransferase [Pseudomonadota bacterium]